MLKTIIIEDERPARQLLKGYIEKTPFLKLEAEFANALDAMAFMRENKVDLIFLDINLPHISGISFLESLPGKAEVIFTTAHRNYAVKAFEYEAVDFLLKPFSFERFTKAVMQVQQQKGQRASSDQQQKNKQIVVYSNKGFFQVNIEDITYLEGMKDYVKLHTVDHKYVVKETMQNTLKKLPSDRFYQVHRSYIISVNYIEELKGKTITVHGKTLPIGDKYHETIKNYILQNPVLGK